MEIKQENKNCEQCGCQLFEPESIKQERCEECREEPVEFGDSFLAQENGLTRKDVGWD